MLLDHTRKNYPLSEIYIDREFNLDIIGQTVKFNGKQIVNANIVKIGDSNVFNQRTIEIYETKGGNFCLFVSHYGEYVMFIQGKDREEIRKNSLLREVFTTQVINKILDISDRVVIEVE